MNIACCQVRLDTGVEDSTVRNSAKKRILETITVEKTRFEVEQFSELSHIGGHWRNQNEAQPLNTWNNRVDEPDSESLSGSNFLDKVELLDKS